MRIVVTGATGLVGERLLSILGDEHEIWALSKSPRPDVSPTPVSWLTANLASPELPADLPATADVVVHLAQSPHYRDFPAQALDIFNVNVGSTARLLDWSRQAGVRQFILASSGAVGIPPLSYYAASKQSAELLAESYADQFRVLVVRFYFVYGHRQKPSMLVARLIETIRSGGAVPLAGQDGPRLNPVHVSDAAGALARAIERQANGVIEIAGPDVLSVRAMSVCVAARLGVEARFTTNEGQQPLDLIGDITRMRDVLGPPRLSFRDGVDQVITAMGGGI